MELKKVKVPLIYKLLKKINGKKEFTEQDIQFLVSDMELYIYGCEEKISFQKSFDDLCHFLSPKEMFVFLCNTHYLKHPLFQYLLECHYEESKSVWKQFRNNQKFQEIVYANIDKVIAKKEKLQEQNYLEFLSPQLQYRFLENQKFNPHYEFIKQEVLNDRKNTEWFFRDIPYSPIQVWFLRLRLFKDSPYFTEIYEKEKRVLYKKWLGINEISKEQEDLFQTAILILEDTFRLAGKTIKDVECSESGSYLNTYEIGEYLIKMGRPGAQWFIPNDRNLFYPLCRKFLKEFNLTLTITFCGQRKNFTNQEVYEVFKETRMNHKKWIDAKYKNVVILQNENGAYPFPVEPWTIGFEGDYDVSPKGIGECVICDLDLFYPEDQVPWDKLKNTVNPFLIHEFQNYEKKYEEEIRLQKSLKN